MDGKNEILKQNLPILSDLLLLCDDMTMCLGTLISLQPLVTALNSNMLNSISMRKKKKLLKQKILVHSMFVIWKLESQ